MGEAEADVVPRAFVFVGRAEEARGVAGFDILIAEEFMEHVGFNIEGALFADVLTEAEATRPIRLSIASSCTLVPWLVV